MLISNKVKVLLPPLWKSVCPLWDLDLRWASPFQQKEQNAQSCPCMDFAYLYFSPQIYNLFKNMKIWYVFLLRDSRFSTRKESYIISRKQRGMFIFLYTTVYEYRDTRYKKKSYVIQMHLYCYIEMFCNDLFIFYSTVNELL